MQATTEAVHVSEVAYVIVQSLTPPPAPVLLAETLHVDDAPASWVQLVRGDGTEAIHVSTTLSVTRTGEGAPVDLTASPEPAETLHVSDVAPTRLLTPLEARPAETLHVSETIVDRGLIAGLSKFLTETLHVTEAITPRLDPLLRTVTETVRVSESATVTIELERAVTGETLHVSETVTASRLNPLLAAAAETLHVSESVTASMGLMTAASETLHVSEAVTVSLTPLRVTVPTETLHVSDTTPTRFLDPLQVVEN